MARPMTLTIAQVIPGLPPEEHGGKIPVTEWIGGKCKWYMENARECIQPDVGQELPKLQGKIHVEPSEKFDLAKLLVTRRICRWVPKQKILRYRGELVLNGMFGVPKPSADASKPPTLRLIMNLVPSNSVLKVLQGKVARLPNICSWSNTVLLDGEFLSICQSDMTAAFYLFQIPQGWSELLAFNVRATAEELEFTDMDPHTEYYLCCGVLPMGWSSAVGIMQYVAEEVLLRNGMPGECQLQRRGSLPKWMVETLDEGTRQKRFWWHVYLDNYASGEVLKRDEEPLGGEWQSKVEGWWEAIGIVASKKKSVKNSEQASELGAYIDGRGQWFGG